MSTDNAYNCLCITAGPERQSRELHYINGCVNADEMTSWMAQRLSTNAMYNLPQVPGGSLENGHGLLIKPNIVIAPTGAPPPQNTNELLFIGAQQC